MNASAATPQLWAFPALGTSWRIETEQPMSDALRGEVSRLIEEFDRAWSRFRDDSLVTDLSRGAGAVPAPPDTAAMLETYAALDTATGGAVNPLVGHALSRRGYDSHYGFVDRGAQRAPADWRQQLSWTDETLVLEPAALIDVGALGKGRLVDRVFQTLRAGQDGAVVVDAGGDIARSGPAEWIGLEHPYDPMRAVGRWLRGEGALCASAVGRRAWGEGLHHVLDARTGIPVRTVAATWATAETAMVADAVATALFFEGGPELAHRWGSQWVRMTTDGRLEWSPGCDAELFLRE